MKAAEGAPQIKGTKNFYVLLMVNAADIDEVKHWFESLSAGHSYENLFVADIKGRPPLEQPIGFAALMKFGSISEMKSTILEVEEELRKRDGWKCDIMKADWIEMRGLQRAIDDSKRRVTTDGRISFKNHRYYVTQRLRGEEVNLKVDNGNLEIYREGVLVKTLKLINRRAL